ncbi:Neuropeptide Y receptor type 1 [Acropora cervicornis]|uniref:Neuropeptide Y receptor type 1 n=1 Tax=Acropora cervicornis TaxID=6130 RepID=A0AAD9V7S1_ACRCE|nr:Neuropeptide Y receptor type 1 [Acropora cervicornis]
MDNNTTTGNSSHPHICKELSCFLTKEERYVIAASLFAIALISLTGNIPILIVTLFSAKRRNSSNLATINLVISDLLMTVFCVPFVTMDLYVFDAWVFGSTMCFLVTFLQNTAIQSSLLNLLIITCEKFLAVRFPFHVRLRKQMVCRFMPVAWMLAVAESIFLVRHKKMKVYENNTYCMYDYPDQQAFQRRVAVTTVTFFCPLAVIIVLHSITAYTLGKGTNHFKLYENEEDAFKNLPRQQKRHKKATKIILVTLISIIICWGPFYVYNALLLFDFMDQLSLRSIHIGYAVHPENPLTDADGDENMWMYEQQTTLRRRFEMNATVTNSTDDCGAVICLFTYERTKVRYLVLGGWILGIIQSSVYLSYRTVREINGVPYCIEDWPSFQTRRIFNVVQAIALRFVPLTFMICLHIVTILKIKARMRSRRANAEQDDFDSISHMVQVSPQALKTRKKAVVMLVVVVAVSAWTLFPYSAYICWRMLGATDSFSYFTSNVIYIVVMWLVFFNSCCHPIIFGLMSSEYRKAAKGALSLKSTASTGNRSSLRKKSRQVPMILTPSPGVARRYCNDQNSLLSAMNTTWRIQQS